MNNWRIVDRPGVARTTTHAHPPISGKSGGAEFSFAPMSMHKQKLLASSSGFETQTLRASHPSPAFSSSVGFCSNTPNSSLCSPASFKGSNAGHGSQEEIEMTHVPGQTLDMGALSTCDEKSAIVDEVAPHVLSPKPEENQAHHTIVLKDVSVAGNSCPSIKGQKANKATRRCPRTSSGLSDEFLSSIHSGSGSGYLLDSYGEGDLTDDWKVGLYNACLSSNNSLLFININFLCNRDIASTIL